MRYFEWDIEFTESGCKRYNDFIQSNIGKNIHIWIDNKLVTDEVIKDTDWIDCIIISGSIKER